MTGYPHTVLDFEKEFITNEKCEEYLYKVKWPEGFVCPYCQSKEFWKILKGYKCEKCKKKSSLTVGTIFQDSHKSLQFWFRAIWYITNQKNGMSANTLQNMLGIGSYKTAWALMHKLRIAMVRPGRDKLSGIVEVDESYIGGGASGKRGRGASNKALVLIAVEVNENKIGRIRLKVIPDASYKSLSNAITELVEKNSLIQTDGWPSYLGIKQNGLKHEVIKKTDSVGENLLPHCHLISSLLKRWLLGTHQGGVEASHLNYYLDEFTFRYNRRKSKSRGLLFHRLIEQAVLVKPVLIKNI